MALLIDGYNLLHVTGIVGRPGTGLQGSREALLHFLAAAIDERELPQTTVVFDAAEAPPGLPRVVMYNGMTVRYAADYEDADALIEELIAANNVPRSLLVVSSDHRIQRAAHRRRAPFVDSDVWFADASRRRSRPSASSPPGRRTTPPSTEEIEFWTEVFGGSATESTEERCLPIQNEESNNPFPPGYAEDLLDENP